MSWISFPCYAALFPQGKFRTLLAAENQPALCTGTHLWPSSAGQAQTSTLCCIPLCPSPLLGIIGYTLDLLHFFAWH